MNGLKKKGQFQEANPELPRATHKSANWLMRSDDESEFCVVESIHSSDKTGNEDHILTRNDKSMKSDVFVYSNHFILVALLSHTLSFKKNSLIQKIRSVNEIKKPHQFLGEAHKSSSWFSRLRKEDALMVGRLPSCLFMCISFLSLQEKNMENAHDTRR